MFYYALLQHRFYLFGLIKRYNFVGTFGTWNDAVGFAYNVNGYAEGTFTVRKITAAEKVAMTLSLLG